MTAGNSEPASEKLIANLTPELRLQMRSASAQRGLNISEATTQALDLWYGTADAPPVEVKDAKSWGTWVPTGGVARFTGECDERGLTKVQGIAQALSLWINRDQPATAPRPNVVRRMLVAIQKGGVGKTFLAGGLAQALAELGLRVLLVDYDPQGHLTRRLGQQPIALDSGGSLLEHMLGKATRHIRRSLVTLPQARFGERLHLLPACSDAFLFDAVMSTMRAGREESLARALEPIENDYDVVILDGPPSLGLAMDIAMHYVQRRPGELSERSGILMPVWADLPSFEAYDLFNTQRKQLMTLARVTVDELGFVLNAYDSRRGASVQTRRDEWEERSAPGVLAVFPDLKEQRDAQDRQIPLLEWEPDCALSDGFRTLAKELAA
ncbi:phosphopantetheine--protein transferase [Streptomyces subrutilus]|uniref:Phosphopantetheine--protein transferase n=2 Tax=Bacteria TaxID=2 RepID=A0A918VD83_9ACTN|nr:ParA family protein [Streptomyces subrutilus]GGZ89664.1 phosphopantetheine--protein transferase [Streptomyces subrutilus]